MAKLPGSVSLIKDSAVDTFKNFNVFLAAGALYFFIQLLTAMGSQMFAWFASNNADDAIIIFSVLGIGLFGILFLFVRTLVLYRLTEIGMNIALGRTTQPASKKDASKYLIFVVIAAILSIVIGFATILLIIPGIYLGVRLAFVLYAYIDRKKGIEDAFKESWNMTKNNFWAILGRWILGIIAVAIVYLIAILVFGAVTVGVGTAFEMTMGTADTAAGLGVLIWQIIFGLIEVVLLAIGLVFFGKIYKALKA